MKIDVKAVVVLLFIAFLGGYLFATIQHEEIIRNAGAIRGARL